MTSTTPHQALYRRWRAQTFSQIVGQEAVVETLRNAVRTDRVSHAILFVGPRGTGKTSMARILAKAVNCTNLQDGDPCDTCEACVAVREGTTLDVLEIDAASNRGINEVRDLRDRLAYPPGHLRRKVYILDEAHQITRDAWNALLKSLEEPPDFVIFIFASTEPSGFPPAILSRLQRYDVRRLTIPEIEGKLTRILEADGRAIEPTALTLIARLAAGGMRDAESILDQLLSTTTETVTEAAVRDLLGLADAAAVDGFVDALQRGDVAAGVDILDRLEERGRDPRALLDQVVDAIRIRLVDQATTDQAGLVAVARRLVAIDPDRAGIGGLRLQLELALFAGGSSAPAAAPTIVVAPEGAAASAPVPPADSATAAEAARATGPAPTPPTEAATVSDESALSTASTDQLPTPKPATTLKAAEKPRAARADRPEGPTMVGATDPATTSKDATPQDEPTPAVEPAVEPAAGHADRPSVAVPIAVGDDLDRLLDGWPEIVKAVSPATRAVLTECRPIAVEGNVVTLGFPEAKGFLKDHAERRRQDVETAVGGLLGRPISVRTVATNIEVAPLGAADDLVAEARRIFGEDLVDVAEID
ncbi:MAG TPA: DNA polymerase III subunit gamma/tau [Candidatus Limnocylindrales bacterium]|nr:DNA polymerase III subunit gamma/tau [Candidatus Limnocylindrales bacterium]